MELPLYERNRLIASLTKVAHSGTPKAKGQARVPHAQRLTETFLADCLPAAQADPGLFAHLVAWNRLHGTVNDSKQAYPVLALRGLGRGQDEWTENAVAHLMALAPWDHVEAYEFNKHLVKPQGLVIPAGQRRRLEDAGKRLLRAYESDRGRWTRLAVRGRAALRTLYAVYHVKPADWAEAILFHGRYPKGSVFEAIATLRHMSPAEAAGTILLHKIPGPIAIGAVAKAKDETILLAILEGMTGNEIVNNSAWVRRLCQGNPVLESAYGAAIERAKGDKRVNTLKAGVAMKRVDAATAKQLEAVQEVGLDRLAQLEGNVCIACDISPSMRHAREAGTFIAATMARTIKGKVYLALFDSHVHLLDVTGSTLEAIRTAAGAIRGGSGTSIGAPLAYLKEKRIPVDLVAIVSDGGDRIPPLFDQEYPRYAQATGAEPAVYLYRLSGPGTDPDWLTARCRSAGIATEKFELGAEVDYYALPNLIATMRASRYALLDEILSVPLLTVERALTSRGD